MSLPFLRSAFLAAICSIGGGCDSKSERTPTPSPPTTPLASIDRVPAELRDKVLARVGERTITLADYAAVLDRMDRFERLRYQTPERRRALLDELINTELLAREAERRGVHEAPETQAYLNQLLRDEVRRRLRAEQPELSDLPEGEVAAYYQAHRDEFHDPERRRVAVIAVRSATLAQRLHGELQLADAHAWGEAVRQHSVLKSGKGAEALPLDLEGDLGLVSAPGQARGVNTRVPAAVRRAVFEISEPGKLAPKVVQEGSLHYLVRLIARSPARARTLEEADTTIRARILRSRLSAAEDELKARLEKEVPVTINESAIRRIKTPAGSESDKP